MSLERIKELLTQLPGHSLVYGGSHAGKLYQNYPWPPLDVLPAHRNDTQARLDWLLEKLGDVEGKRIADVGSANGAIALGLTLRGAWVFAITPDPIEAQIAEEAWWILPHKVSCPLTSICDSISNCYLTVRQDATLFLSAWKWIVRNEGLERANRAIEKIARNSESLIFESGLTDGGMDLGIGITKADIPDILRKHTGCEPELLGIEPREDGTEREVWRCRR